MKHIFKKLHIGSNHDPNRSNETLAPVQSPVPASSDQRVSSSQTASVAPPSPSASPSPVGTAAAPVAPAVVDGSGGDYFSSEEEFQMQLALAISASNSDFRGNDPENNQIRAATLLSLGGQRRDGSGRDRPDISPETQSRQYWEYNVLDYEEKVVNGFYDAYGLSIDTRHQGKMPSLSELDNNPGSSGYEVIVVNREIDHALQELVQIAQCIILDCPTTKIAMLVQRLAELVTGHMGGPVKDANFMLSMWMERSMDLRMSLHTSLLPIGSINIGLSRHRALLFKVLADDINFPCRLVKGSLYTGVDDDVVNIIKLEDEREFLVDLMAAPGTLIPVDFSSTKDNSPYNPKLTQVPFLSKEHGIYYSRPKPILGEGSSRSSMAESSPYIEGRSSSDKPDPHLPLSDTSHDLGVGTSGSSVRGNSDKSDHISATLTDNYSYKGMLGGHAVNEDVRMNINVVPHNKNNSEDPKNLFADLNPFQIKGFGKAPVQKYAPGIKVFEPQRQKNAIVSGNPPAPLMWKNRHAFNEVPKKKEYDYMESLFPRNDKKSNVNKNYPSGLKLSNNMNTSGQESNNQNPFGDARLELGRNQNPFEWVPSVEYVETESSEGRAMDMENLQSDTAKEDMNEMGLLDHKKCTYNRFMETDSQLKDSESPNSSVESSTNKGRHVLDDVDLDVGESEIQWEDLVIGERIGLGSYGEVYRADWNATEVAVKKFLDQDFSGAALEEFKQEVRIMRRLRHPNVVLFMGAVTRPPHLSIITEYLPRGSLYRIIHRPHCQIDEKRRIKMALDVARGMNCLHTSNPTIVHRDLKSPNLLVDKNWNVKVGDFGLSRLKHNTFLSSKSTAGTPEWMAPEVLRNEPSNEKCDVYSFGIILWELATLRLPWSGMNPMQVVGAVGFQNRRLDIPKELDPKVASIIWGCWQTEPNLRPSFSELSVALKSLQRLVVPSQLDQPNQSFPQERTEQSSSALELSVNTNP
ncbi:hypothetical protein SAY87_010551 [Trapa incisa]|uniref:non-specific serine/threonine protein kinase n=1 Tax=Trapa incisa TaxID=236973 RepID=A0AAN7GUD2_9MYRT|nr:hypothetical protein SAY87_010551 [Trapa incisa]